MLTLWLCGLSAILYLDRICLSQAVVPIQKELDLTNTHMSYILMVFSLAYGLFCKLLSHTATGEMGEPQTPRNESCLAVWCSAELGDRPRRPSRDQCGRSWQRLEQERRPLEGRCAEHSGKDDAAQEERLDRKRVRRAGQPPD